MKKIMPPTYFYLCILVAILLHLLLPGLQLIFFPYRLLGIILLGLGAALNICSVRLFEKAKTTEKLFQKPRALVIKGPYCFTRNPMYLGGVCMLLGIGVLLGSFTAFAPALFFFFLMNAYFIPREERMLNKIFGQKFKNYRKKARRWL